MFHFMHAACLVPLFGRTCRIRL